MNPENISEANWLNNLLSSYERALAAPTQEVSFTVLLANALGKQEACPIRDGIWRAAIEAAISETRNAMTALGVTFPDDATPQRARGETS